MDMSVPKIAGQSVVAGSNELNKKTAAANEKTGQDDRDTVSISERGMQLAGSTKADSGDGMEASGEVNVKDLQQELQKAQKEVASVKDEIEALKRQAEADPMKKAELGKKQSKLRNLEDEASDLKADMYT